MAPSAGVEHADGRPRDPAPHRRPGSGRSARASLLLAALVLVCTSLSLGWTNGLADGRLVDKDAYTWVHRAAELRAGGQWFDDTLRRVDPPRGLTQHWSRPFDAVLLAGGIVGEPFVGFRAALFGWAVLVPTLLGLVTLWLLWWGFSDLLDAAGQHALALLFAMQLTIVMGFMAGRPDHQALMGSLVIAVAGLARRAFRANGGGRAALLAGALSGIALWVGMEAALLVCGLAAGVAVQWVAGDDDAIVRLRSYGLALAAATGVALIAEHGLRGAMQTQLDELSVALVAAALLLSAGCAVLWRFGGRLRSPARRTAALVVVAASSLAALIAVFPGILDGPLGTVDPLYARTRLQYIGEVQPLVGPSLRETVMLVVPGLSLVPLVVAYLLGHASQPSRLLRSGMHLLLVPAAVYLAMAIGQQRWLFPLNLLLVVPASLGAQRIMHAAAPAARRVNLRMVAVAGLVALWWVPFFAWSAPGPSIQCDVDDAVAALGQADEGSTVMAFVEHGPELLVRTSHRVMSIPNHRHQPGYTATYQAMSATNATVARDVIQRTDVDLLLVCTDRTEAAFYGGDPASFHARLAGGRPPAWLETLPTAGGEPRFLLYRVTG